MAKKNPNRFSLQFASDYSLHQAAVEILNSVPERSRSDFVAKAILTYDEVNSSCKNYSSFSKSAPSKESGRTKTRDAPARSEKPDFLKDVSDSFNAIEQEISTQTVTAKKNSDGIDPDMAEVMSQLTNT